MTFMTDIPQLADLRARVLRGDEITPEEYMIVLASIRQHRSAGAAKKAAKTTGADPADLLNQLFKE